MASGKARTIYRARWSIPHASQHGSTFRTVASWRTVPMLGTAPPRSYRLTACNGFAGSSAAPTDAWDMPARSLASRNRLAIVSFVIWEGSIPHVISMSTEKITHVQAPSQRPHSGQTETTGSGTRSSSSWVSARSVTSIRGLFASLASRDPTH